MEKIIVQYLPKIEIFINNLSDVLFRKEYFSFYEYAENYVDQLTFFIEKEMINFPHKATPKALKKIWFQLCFLQSK